MSKGDGLKIGIKFTEDLVGDVSSEGAFTITGKEYKYVNGLLIDKEYQVDKVERYPAIKTWQDDFNNGVVDDVKIGTEGIILATGGAAGTGYTDDLTSGLTYISTSDFSTSYAKHMAFDDNTSSSWSAIGIIGQAVGVDFGSIRKISKLRMLTNGRLKNFDLEGSNDNSTWAVVYTGTQLGDSNWQEYAFENLIGYRYYRVKCTGSLHTGENVMITEIEMMESAYVGEGNYTIVVPTQDNGQYRLRWAETKPTNTNIIIEYTTGQTQGQWQEVENGDVVNANTNLWIRATLSTEDTAITPILQDLWLEETSAPQDKILITMDWWGKFNNIEGDLTVKYDATKGNLTGRGGAVESFSVSFSPKDLIPEPNPGIQEYITVAPSVQITFITMEYVNAYEEEHITAVPSVQIRFEEKGVINP